MSTPKLPKSSLGGGKSELRHWIELGVGLVAVWELVWLVFLLAGDSPQGQIWSSVGRWLLWWTRSVQHQPPPGGWLWAEWGVSRPVFLGPIFLVFAGLVILAGVVFHLAERGPRESRSPRRERLPKGPRGGGGRGRQQPQKAENDDEVDDDLETFLVKEQAGRGDD